MWSNVFYAAFRANDTGGETTTRVLSIIICMSDIYVIPVYAKNAGFFSEFLLSLYMLFIQHLEYYVSIPNLNLC